MPPTEGRSGGNDVALEAAGVSFAYGSTAVLSRVAITVCEGEFVAVVGRSGSGKSTLLKILAGVMGSTGNVTCKGRAILVFQDALLLPWLRVKENVGLAFSRRIRHEVWSERGRGGSATSGSGEAIDRRVEELLHELGMWDLRARFPGELSGGERQRVAIARAFAAWPEVVLMDEPFGSLDVFTRENMQTWLLDFWSRHRAAIVFVTHDVEEALAVADRVLVLADGRLGGEVKVPFARPRPRELRYTPEFISLRERLSARVRSP